MDAMELQNPSYKGLGKLSIPYPGFMEQLSKLMDSGARRNIPLRDGDHQADAQGRLGVGIMATAESGTDQPDGLASLWGCDVEPEDTHLDRTYEHNA